ncbi:translation initiation factor IF-2 [Parasphingopyxis marina]|uniref:Translation initiation factor IF-2 n=1 Tax=Parasphingopyxis marina TaxID=2761622 RepID=A0A842I1Y6_9SPHN|nr:translation initiation factor IF-2 [Parasphingopyxis marina]MBC2779195.1 translation initiation factor IF-2 [Parasphingopyxis marina]
MSDDTKKTLGTRTLGVKRTVEGKVQQQFSHGRKNTVVVERKKRRVLTKPGETPAPAPVEEEAKAPPPPPPAAKEAPKRTPKTSEADETLSRKEKQEKLLREAEEARLAQLEDARRREDEAKKQATEEEAKRAEDNRKAEKTASKAEEEAAEAVSEAEVEAEAVAEGEADASGGPALDPDKPAPRSFTPVAKPKRPDKKKDDGGRPSKRDDRKERSKLTVNRALRDGEGGVRSRSLAALKRAREKEKEKRAHADDGPQVKKARDVVVPEAITVGELAKRMDEKGADLVKSLFKMGMAVTVNQTVDQDTAELLVTEFGHNIQRVSESDVEIGIEGDEDKDADLKPRPPVVTIMGHVDHGKTSLLDALRGTDVVAGEAGGITQHIGAYQVKTKEGTEITFLDTPGHEAFTAMRARGANVTDIVIIVVAANDGIMPQTIEAINHTKAAGVPMIIAINKMDAEGADAKNVRARLLEHEVVVEEMSGDVQDVEVSALKRTGLDELMEKITLQAELLELKANPDRAAEGTVIEAKLDKGRGPVATILVSRGTLKTGDIFVVGAESGKVRAMVNDKGEQVKEAGPSVPVEVLGLSGVPGAGDPLTVVPDEARAREVAEYRADVLQRARTTQTPTSVENMFSAMAEEQAIEFPVVIKADTQGSVEAIIGSLENISTDDIRVRVLHSGVGGITESDVTLASASKVPIIGFHVRANAKAREVAQRDNVKFKYFDVIYDLIDEIRGEMAGELGPEKVETVVGRAEVKEVFPAGKKDKAAGLLVTDGFIKKGLHTRLMRDDVIVSATTIASLRRFKDDVDEVRSGLECGVLLEDTNDVKPGDTLEVFEVELRERTL